MKIYDGIHWNINEILPYQRNFNFINGKRSLGKTYTCLLYVINYCINNKLEFIYLVRTQDEKKQGVLYQALEKVVSEKFKIEKFEFNNENAYYNFEDNKKIIAHCFALSEAVKIKRRSFPNVKFIIFDEYMLEKFQTFSYVNGWHEPDLFLSIYHTVDRESDRVICFLLGNTLNFFNPYHIHPAFSIPQINCGEIWCSENVLFQWAKSSENLKKQSLTSKFVKMIHSSSYGSQAVNGNYVDNNTSFIKKLSGNCYYYMTLIYRDEKFGVYIEKNTTAYIITDKINKNYKQIYALSYQDHKDNTIIARKSGKIKNLIENYKIGNVFFSSMIIKTKIEKAIINLL